MVKFDKSNSSALQTVWSFLCPDTPLSDLKKQEFDAIFVFGGVGMEIPQHAANLYKEGIASIVLVTGKSGALTSKHFDQEESIVFKDVLLKEGVSEEDVLIDIEATNAGENVQFGMKVLQAHDIQVKRLVLVCRSFMMRRALATFKKQFPGVVCLPSVPPITSSEINLSEDRLISRLVSEVERLEKYPDEGFIEPVEIPFEVWQSVENLQKLLSKTIV